MQSPSCPLPDVQSIADALQVAVEGAVIQVCTNPAASEQHSLLLPADMGFECAHWLKHTSPWKFDYLSNATGIDWPKGNLDKKKEDASDSETPEGYLEVVYHLYSIRGSLGPLIIRFRTQNRTDQVKLPSMTPIWRSAELQEREIFDLYGVHFDGHPDLRRVLMWDEFEGHPMRRDYVEPDDFEYEPTPHAEVKAKSEQYQNDPAASMRGRNS
ncbi:MAG: NADH-quinone oxidoreductase subunit C [Verrucomicrobiota bacterium]|nr:NADH-quinone oxidoreductase subunit C [Verrucomicrobiota bacterium]